MTTSQKETLDSIDYCIKFWEGAIDPEEVEEDPASEIRALLAEEHAIAIVLCTDHVLDTQPDLTEGQAWEVLQEVGRCLRALPQVPCIEETIRQVAESMFPEGQTEV
jgi:hypothetical protein